MAQRLKKKYLYYRFIYYHIKASWQNVISATPEAEAETSQVQGQPGQRHETLSKRERTGGADVCLALGSSLCTDQKPERPETRKWADRENILKNPS